MIWKATLHLISFTTSAILIASIVALFYFAGLGVGWNMSRDFFIGIYVAIVTRIAVDMIKDARQ